MPYVIRFEAKAKIFWVFATFSMFPKWEIDLLHRQTSAILSANIAQLQGRECAGLADNSNKTSARRKNKMTRSDTFGSDRIGLVRMYWNHLSRYAAAAQKSNLLLAMSLFIWIHSRMPLVCTCTSFDFWPCFSANNTVNRLLHN